MILVQPLAQKLLQLVIIHTGPDASTLLTFPKLSVLAYVLTGGQFRVQELCESGGGRPGLPVPNSPHGLCGRKAVFEWRSVVSLAGCRGRY